MHIQALDTSSLSRDNLRRTIRELQSENFLGAARLCPRGLSAAGQLPGHHRLDRRLQFFTEAHVMTGGSGSLTDSTMMMSIYLWQTAFRFFKMGYASAQAWVLFLIIVTFTAILFKTSGRVVYYGGK
jgi:hypothetical protein